jgi:tetratricopeptide (TPR) repeat protein
MNISKASVTAVALAFVGYWLPAAQAADLTQDQINAVMRQWRDQQRAKTAASATGTGTAAKGVSTPATLQPASAGGAQALAIVTTYWQKAQEAQKLGNKAAAMRYYTAVAESNVPQAAKQIEAANEALRILEEEAVKRFADARQAKLKANYTEARTICIEVMETWPQAVAVKEAKEMLMTLAKDPKCASAIMFDDASAEQTAENYLNAIRIYKRIVELYPDQVNALKAKAKVAEMEADEKISGSIKKAMAAEADKAGPQTIRTAENFAVNGKYAEAIAYLDRVIEQYPGTEPAAKAAELRKTYEAAKKAKEEGGGTAPKPEPEKKPEAEKPAEK